MTEPTQALVISKVVPARPAKRVTAQAKWCKRDFMTAGRLAEARGKMRLKPMGKTCWWCSYTFLPDDMIALAYFPGKGQNKTLCQSCADELLRGET